ncbi:MAG: hypothetical protein KAR79_06330 [Simkaniaceae bacterium]|nr:hypothetical protein [Simkaniaceae bacterium]
MDRNLTNRIIIPLKDTLPLIKYLFEKNVISAEQHLGLRDKLVELKACANYQAKLTDSMISMDQFNLLNQLALPHLSVLKKHMDNSTIKEALSHAHPYAMGLLDLEKSFKVIMCKERVMKAFSPEEQSTLCPSLLALGKILGGKALIEDSLLLSTDSLPDLKVQKNIIFSHLL